VLCSKSNKRRRQVCLTKQALHIYGLSIWEKAWKLYDLETQEFFESRDVVFHEELFPFKKEQLMTGKMPENRVERNMGSIPQAEYVDNPNSTDQTSAGQHMDSLGLDTRGSDEAMHPTNHITEGINTSTPR